MKIFLVVLFQLFAAASFLFAEEIQTVSPDGNVIVYFDLSPIGEPQYKISFGGNEFMLWSKLGLNLKDGGKISADMKVIAIERETIDETYRLYSGKSAFSRNYCSETRISLQESSAGKRKLDIIFRA
ncbi:MAG: glycoside hydrolase family 97 N-terminal domain-containing protein, partial [Ignavibacteria bacterium]|nr:glycoside hydrolase family 97 N-terminal domain-containing protein [Ignavibacteria bacterium]